MADKLILSNDSALATKYGVDVGLVHAAVQRLITADAARGLTTQYVSLDDAVAMAQLSAVAVADTQNEQQTKDAIDAVYRAGAPDYLMLLGAPDVVCHQSLLNPLFGVHDNDQVTPSDLPYACDAPFGGEPENFTGPSRILGRLPDVTGGSDAAAFAGVIDAVAVANSLAAELYGRYFGLSTETWQASTALSLQTLIGNSNDLHLSPPDGPAWTVADLSSLSHFINCHGNTATPQFFGESAAGDTPVSDDAALVTGNVMPGTVAAVECCYGAELYDPALAGGQVGIANTYIAGGAYGYWGSTNIAYGPPSGNKAADLLAQYYLKGILAGSSSGSAAADARLEFVQVSSPLNPVDLKTLSQFILLGDPSLQPAATAPPVDVALAKAAGMTSEAAAKNARAVRRRSLTSRGLELSQNRAVASSTPFDATGQAMMKQLQAVAEEAGLDAPQIRSFPVRNAGTFRGSVPKTLAMKAPEPTIFHVILGRLRADRAQRAVAATVAIVVEESNGVVRSVQRLQRKSEHGNHRSPHLETCRRRLEVRTRRFMLGE